MNSRRSALFVGIVALAGTASVSAQVINESEPNDSKATANTAVFTAPGATIVGNSQASTGVGLDYFRVTTPASVPGIYQNRLVISSTIAGHTGTLRGLNQTASGTNSTGPGVIGTTDNTAQTSSTTSTPPRFNQWYTFGPSADVYYRVAGSATTTADYTATYSQTPVVPVNLGTYNSGNFTFTNLGLNSTQDTEVFVYNSSFQPIAGGMNDDALDAANGGPAIPPGSSGLNSYLQMALSPGTYYLALANFNTADNQASSANEGTATGTVVDFAGLLMNSSTTAFASIPFSIIHPDGTFTFNGVKAGAYDIYFGQFTVSPVPEPTSLALCGVALAGFTAIRRRKTR